MSSFLPVDYKIPEGGKPYTKLEQGDTRIRILSSPILGTEYWIDSIDEEGKPKRQPVRLRMNEKVDIANVPEPDKMKHFWAMVVWNYNTKRLEILELTQKSIMRYIEAHAKNPAWGDPKGTNGYDFVINRTGEGFDTEYVVSANPKTKLDKEIVEQYESSDIYLEALFDNGDPFAGTPINIDKIK
jgi:hypothetical protein